MKKVLFATTALVATAGVAAADVAITGGAEMGVAGGSEVNTTFHQSVDVRFTMSGEADGGLQFGAQIDLDDLVDTGADPVDVQGDFADFTVFISGDFGTLTMGDTDGALDWALQEVNLGSPGSINDDETAHAGYFGNSFGDGFGDFDGQVLRYDYSIGDFGVALSAEVDDDDGLEGDYVIALGANYSFGFSGGSVVIGAGYQYANDTTIADAVTGDDEGSIIGLSAGVELDAGFSAAVNYSQLETDQFGDGEHMAIGASYTFDMITVHANYGQFDWDATATVADSEGFGLAAAYDLGGGLSAHLGYGWSDVTASNASTTAEGDSNTFSLGLAMSF
ncbi:porin [Gymnodinialimonas sp. 2305UL16-5]|uniref:porin n=1 Tax=Gymnodinialimonas mytili TaxID=3126503 RepID=UPI0030B1B17C